MIKQITKKLYNKVIFPLMILLMVAAGCSNDEGINNSQKEETDGKFQKEETDGKVLVEILYLDHWPIKNSLNEVEKMLESYENEVSVQFYTFDTSEGKTFAKNKDISSHTPIVIFVNGEMEHTLEGKRLKFYSFPEGEGTIMVESGGWSITDLEKVIQLAIGDKT